MLTNGGRDAKETAATIGATMTADRSYTQLNDSPVAASAITAAGSHLGCNGTCSGGGGSGGPISRDTSMSTQVVVLSPATPTEAAAVDEEGKGQITNSLRLAFAPKLQI